MVELMKKQKGDITRYLFIYFAILHEKQGGSCVQKADHDDLREARKISLLNEGISASRTDALV